MTLSIAIVTYRRPKDLGEAIDSILRQKVLPTEMVVVDNGADSDTESLISRLSSEFRLRNIAIRYVRNPKNSLTAGRNLAVKHTSGDIVLFLDDDVILHEEYTAELLRVYEEKPDALGAQGYIHQPPRSWFSNSVRAFFCWYHTENNRQRVLKSVSATYPAVLESTINCECLSGANHSFRRQVYSEFQYDEKLLKYSEGEDLDIAYRVHLKYPGSLWITPSARLIHKTSSAARAVGNELITMQEVYGLYLFYKLFNPNCFNKSVYLWSRIGRVVLSLYHAVWNWSGASFLDVVYLLLAYIKVVSRIRSIQTGELSFFNQKLL